MGKAKEKKKFKMRRGKNLLIQLAVMLPISAVQSFAGIFALFGLYNLIAEVQGKPVSGGGLGLFGGVAAFIFGVAVGVVASVIMVKLKGAEPLDVEWNPNFEYDLDQADVNTLQNVYGVAKKYYKLSQVPDEVLGDRELLCAFYANEIQSVDLTEMDEADRKYILNALSCYKRAGGDELHLTLPTIIWTILSPIAFLLQWVAVCAAINQLSSRKIFSNYGQLPFPDVCLKFYVLQIVCHFLFNFVIISEIKLYDWMGSIDEREKESAK